VTRARLLAVLALLAVLLVPGARGGTKAMKGDQRVLVVLATYGPQPYTVASVRDSLRQSSAFFERASFGQTRLRATVTPWLTAFAGPTHCANWTSPDTSNLDAFVAPLRSAAAAAGYDLGSYDRFVYAAAGTDCRFLGIAWDHSVIVTPEPTPPLLVHELGHTYGIAHAGSTACASICPVAESGDPFSPMGDGFSDFSVYEKALMGWIPAPITASKNGIYRLARGDVKSKLPHALLVPTEAGEYWLELRKGPEMMIRLVNPAAAAPPFAAPPALLMSPTKKRRPWVAKGETFRAAGFFTAKLGSNGISFRVSAQTSG